VPFFLCQDEEIDPLFVASPHVVQQRPSYGPFHSCFKLRQNRFRQALSHFLDHTQAHSLLVVAKGIHRRKRGAHFSPTKMMKRSNCSAVFPTIIRGEEDDVSVVSDTSSLGNMLQIPQSFLHRKSSSTKPHTVFTSPHAASSPTNSSSRLLRKEANMQRLVGMAKHQQLESEYGIPPPPPPAPRTYKIVTQSSPYPSRPRANSSSTTTPADLASPRRSKNNPLFFRRANKSRGSAAATGSFSDAIQEMEPVVPLSPPASSQPSSRRRRDEEERSWRWRIPGFHSPKSTTMVLI
jgi:hypothetical protein